MIDENFVASLIASKGDNAVGGIVDFMRKTGLTAGCYAYKFRVKSNDDLLSKKQRKILKKPNYKITDITDVIGVRLVTLFKGDMLKIYESLISKLAHPDSDSIFCQNIPEEIIVFKGDSALEDFPNEIKSITKSHFKNAQVKSEVSVAGYSSIHVICRHHVTINELTQVANSDYRLPIEIQIRTVFEDAWGEIDHKYGYVFREGKDSGKLINNFPFIKAHLKVLKDFTDACMEYAECIRKEALPETPDVTTATTKTISVESDADVLQRFRDIGINNDFIERYVEARTIRNSAAVAPCNTPEDRATTSQSYLQAAELFASLCQELAPSELAESLKDGHKLAYYYCAMNEGLCLMSTNSPDYINSAVEKYRFIETHYKNYPLAKMRFGQALGKIGKIDESIEMLKVAKSMHYKQGEKSIATGSWSDHLPMVDYEHMAFTLPKILGYTIWKKSQRSKSVSRNEKAELYHEAYLTTLDCLEVKNIDEKRLLEIENNLLYYSVGFVFNADTSDPRLVQIKSDLPAKVEAIQLKRGGKEKMPIEDLDTVFRASALLQAQNTKEIAMTLIQRCLRKDENLITSLRMSIAEVAQEYLDKNALIQM